MCCCCAELVEFEEAVKMAEATIAAVSDEITTNTRTVVTDTVVKVCACLCRSLVQLRRGNFVLSFLHNNIYRAKPCACDSFVITAFTVGFLFCS